MGGAFKDKIGETGLAPCLEKDAIQKNTLRSQWDIVVQCKHRERCWRPNLVHARILKTQQVGIGEPHLDAVDVHCISHVMLSRDKRPVVHQQRVLEHI